MISAAVAYYNKVSVTLEIVGKNDFASIYRFYRSTVFCFNMDAAPENRKVKYGVYLCPVLYCDPADHRPGELSFQIAESALLLDLFLSCPRPCFIASPLFCLALLPFSLPDNSKQSS